MQFLSADPVAIYGCACRLHLEWEANQAEELFHHPESTRDIRVFPPRRPGHDNGRLVRRESASYKIRTPDDINAADYIRLHINRNQPYSWTVVNPPPPTFPAEPFLQSPLADVVLQSSDAMNFYVSRAIMSYVSSVFRDMFTLPRPTLQADLPTVALSEHSSVLDALLRVCYPLCSFTTDDLSVMANAVAAAIKYNMDTAANHLKKRMMEQFGSVKPAGLYCVFADLGLENKTADAAKLCLGQTIIELSSSPFWRVVSAKHFKRLQQYSI